MMDLCQYIKKPQENLGFRYPYIIGIGGITRSGKSTITKILAEKYRGFVIHQDDWWKPKNERPWNEKFLKSDMESPESVDWKKIHKDIVEKLEKSINNDYLFLFIELFF